MLIQKILITGASGKLATKLINKLAQNENFQVFASVRDVAKFFSTRNIVYVSKEKLLKTNLLSGVDCVINCAFPRKNDNVALAEALFEYQNLVLNASKLGVKRFINISSQSVYGDFREQVVSENAPICPQDQYAFTKYAIELLGEIQKKQNLLKLTNIRLASLIGIDYPERVINKIIKNAISEPIISINNDKNVFGYMDIEDAVDGLIAFINNAWDKDWENSYNFGVIQENFKDFAWIATYINFLFEQKGNRKDLDIQKKDKAEKLCLMDSKKFYEIADWQPKFSLEQSIQTIFNYYI